MATPRLAAHVTAASIRARPIFYSCAGDPPGHPGQRDPARYCAPIRGPGSRRQLTRPAGLGQLVRTAAYEAAAPDLEPCSNRRGAACFRPLTRPALRRVTVGLRV